MDTIAEEWETVAEYWDTGIVLFLSVGIEYTELAMFEEWTGLSGVLEEAHNWDEFVG